MIIMNPAPIGSFWARMDAARLGSYGCGRLADSGWRTRSAGVRCRCLVPAMGRSAHPALHADAVASGVCGRSPELGLRVAAHAKVSDKAGQLPRPPLSGTMSCWPGTRGDRDVSGPLAHRDGTFCFVVRRFDGGDGVRRIAGNVGDLAVGRDRDGPGAGPDSDWLSAGITGGG